MSKIVLENMQFYAYHGHFKEEQLVGTNFEISLTIDVDTTLASKTDNLDDALNYQELYLLVKDEMAINSKLIEHVGNRIVKKVLDTFPQIKEIQLKLSKLNPPLGGQIEKVSIEMQEKR
jgi:dihydroneopterin aldolase